MLIPNWIIHLKWARKLGISENIINMVNAVIDYGVVWHHNTEFLLREQDDLKSNTYYELKYFYEKDPNTKQFLKAGLIHYLLDFFQETREDINDVEIIFEKYLTHKLFPELKIEDNITLNLKSEMESIFTLLRKNYKELVNDLKGFYFTNSC